MRKLLLAMILSAGLTGCFAHGGDDAVRTPTMAPAAYIYMNGDGSCWADDHMFALCPWTFGGPQGYYYFWEGRYIWHGDRVWTDRTAPPPRAWIAPPANQQNGNRSWRVAPWPHTASMTHGGDR